jgi:ADP-heptose:LPS heptosyltransferase
MHLVLLRLSALGDILRVLPAWKNLLDAFPAARVQAVVEDRHEFLLTPFPRLEPVIVHRRRLSNPCTAIAELRRVAGLIRGADISLDFHGILKSALIPYFAGITERWGDGHTKEGASWLQNNHADYKKQSRYAQALGLTKVFGIKHGMADLGRFEPVLKDIHLPEGDAWQSSSPGHPRLLLVPGTSKSGAHKRWPLNNWIQLAKSLKANADLRWALGPEEKEWRAWLPEKSGVDALPPLPFWELASVIRTVDRVIVGDTGILHLAVLLGVQVTALLGPSDPVISGIPLGSGVVVRTGAECSPCRERRCLRRSCMRELRLENSEMVLQQSQM